MSFVSNNLKVREVIHQVVNDPNYRKVSSIPLFSLHQIGLTVLAYVLVFSGIYLASIGISLWLVYPMMAFGFYTSFTPLHDATHRAVSSNPWLNDWIGTLNGNLLFPCNNTTMYRYFHLAHHRYVGDKDLDPDEAMVGAPVNHFPWGYLVFFIYEYFIVRWFLTKVWHRTPNKTKAIVLATFGANILFYVVMFSSPWWYEFLIWFFIPNRLGAAYTTYTFAHLPHPEGVHIHEHPFQATFNLTGHKVILDSFWGQKDHALHHFLPHIPWYKYKKVWSLANGIFHRQAIPQRRVYAPPIPNFKEKMLERGPVDDGKRTLEARLTSVTDVASEVKQFVFEPMEGQSFPAFTAGAHINVQLPSGILRSYSLVNPSYERNRYQVAVKKEAGGRGGSLEMHEQLKVGNSITISTPKNNFVLYENVPKYILISGGIGITPLISMAHRLVELDKHFEFHICAKTKEQIPFRFELDNWTFAPNIEMHLDKNGKSTMDLDKVLAAPNTDTLIYICGPNGFSQWIKKTAQHMGWDTNQIKEERFSSPIASQTDNQPFELVLNKSEKTITVDEKSTIVDALLMNNIKVEYSCLQGTCGTCIANVVSGEIDHRDAVLSEEEKSDGNKICLCVSRAKGDQLMLDL
ncbi:MAG: fatty acid desaturase [Bacteroidota bacterium]